jgi:hypothetical protein
MNAHWLPTPDRIAMNQPQHGHFPHPPPPTASKRPRRWPWVLLGMPVGAIVMLVVVGIAGGSNRPTAPSTTPAAPATADALGGAAAVHAPRATLQPTPAPPAPSGPLTTFGDGTWEVGVDIQTDGYFETQGCADWVKADR